jgi:hypothetical protein
MSGAIRHFPYTPSWRGQGQLHLLTLSIIFSAELMRYTLGV